MKNIVNNSYNYFLLCILTTLAVFFSGSVLKGQQTPINYGECLSGTISFPAEGDSYTVQGVQPGDILIVRVVSIGSVRPCVKIYKGTEELPGDCESQFVAYFETAPLSSPVNSVTITVDDNSHSFTGEYTIFVEKANPPISSQNIICGQPEEFNLDCNGEIFIWKFGAQANSLFNITLSSTSSVRPCLQIRNSAGDIVIQDCESQFSAQVQLQVTGPDCYYVYCSDYGGFFTGIVSLDVNPIIGGCDTLCAPAIPLEICGNGLDDNSNSLTDCADPYCGTPSIQTVTTVNPTNCPTPNDGSISIAASTSGGVGGQVLYSINGGTNYQQTASFPGLTPGIYSVRVSNSASGCTANYTNNPITLTGPNCSEICDNGMDDDNDGLTDCEDFDCGPAEPEWYNAPSTVCPNSPFVLTLTSADANFDYELYKDNGTDPLQTKSGTGDTLLFEDISINNTATFKIVAVKKSNPDCVFDFSTQNKNIIVDTGRLAILIDTIFPEGAVSEDGKIGIGLPAGVAPFTLVYEPSNRGQLDETAQGPPQKYDEYFELIELRAGYYNITVTDANGCSNSIVAFVDNPEKRRIGFPPAIILTPNGDDYNDFLVFDGLFGNPDKNELTIFNRYGSVVFPPKPYNNDWDATYNGNPVPPDTYFYYLRVFEQEEVVYEGYITVVR